MTDRMKLLNKIEDDIANLGVERIALRRRADQLSTWRAMLFVGALVAVVIGFNSGTVPGIVALIAGMVVFGVAVKRHRTVMQAIREADALLRIKAANRARMTLQWEHIPLSNATAPANHPFALDLDLVGEYSMHRLMDTSVSRGGSHRLLDWLLQTTPDREQIEGRQTMLKAMLPHQELREALTRTAMLSGTSGKWEGKHLLEWLQKERRHQMPFAVLWVLIALAGINGVMLALDAYDVLEGGWVISFLIYGLVSAFVILTLGETFGSALKIKSELDSFTAILRFLEDSAHRPETADVQSLYEPFAGKDNKPSAMLRGLNIVLAGSSLRANPILWFMVNILIPWDVFFGLQLGRSRGNLSRLVPLWLEAWYEIEALNALANFAYLNPEYVFPTVGDRISARQVGHPLLLHERRVTNDFSVERAHEVGMITGSNMSGKSSFLRTIGVNLVMTYAGGVVCAAEFSVPLYRIYTCIRVADSVVDGISYFYAEVRRLKGLLDAFNEPSPLPVFFLIDEIFKGTNNRERLIGSRAYIRALAQQSGVGMVSTHDLELTKLADELPHVINYHFREEVTDGKMVFDYRLRSGPCPTTNALKIMAIEGLPVDGDGA